MLAFDSEKSEVEVLNLAVGRKAQFPFDSGIQICGRS